MSENKQIQEHADQGKKHEYWLALKAAYEQYQVSFWLLDSAIAQREPEDPAAVFMGRVEAHQRAFEQYIEARLDLVECCVDQTNEPRIDQGLAAGKAVPPLDRTRQVGRAWVPFAKGSPIMQLLAVLLLCVAALSVILRQRHSHELQSDLDELQVRLDQVRASIPPARQVTNAKGELPPSVIREDAHRTATAAAAHRQSGTIPQVRPSLPARTGQKKTVPVTGIQKVQSGAQWERFGMPRYYSFALAPSRQFQRVGPIRVHLSAVDPKKQLVKLTIVSDFGRLDLQQLKPNQPVRILVGNREKPLEFVVDRIGRSSLEGHLAQSQSHKVDLLASKLLPRPYSRATD